MTPMRWRHPLNVAKAVNQIIADSDLPRRDAEGTQAVVQAAPPRLAPALRFPSHLKLPRSSPRACGVAVAVRTVAVAVAATGHQVVAVAVRTVAVAVAYRSPPTSVLSRLTSSEHSLLSTAPTASPGART
jgi:hypothetical protein